MSQDLSLTLKGLNTSSNQLNLPDGALKTAENIVINRPGLAESRRGMKRLANPLSSAANRVQRLTEYQSHLIAYRSDDSKLCYYVSGAGWTDYASTYLHPDSTLAKMRFIQANQNLYFTTDSGIKMLDAYNGAVYSTGMPQGLDGSGSTTGASGMMSNNTQVAYRVVWGNRDANNNLYLGSPSQRIIVSNSSGGTRDVSLTITIPSGIATTDFFQVYRSKESATSTTEPNDELQLCYENNPTAGEVAALSLTFTENCPISLLGAYLYTNSSQEGIAESNDIPPFANDISYFKDFTFFANTKTKHKLNINLLAVSGSGLALNDTITINGMVFTAKAATTVANREFKLSSGGSASQNIDDTARALVSVINQYSSNTSIYAFYTTGYSDLPGQIRLEARSLSASSFTVTASNSVAWKLNTGTSSNETNPNQIMWSKIQQPEHVPAAHTKAVGSKSYPIRRILPLKNSLFILKDDGVFRLTGTGGQWTVEPFDTSTVILAPDSAVVVNNQIIALTNQGICSISDVGVQVMSEPIKDGITTLMGLNLDNLKQLSFGISYETDRKYILFTITSATDTYPTQAWVMNTFTQQWTKYIKDITCGIIAQSDDKMYLASATDKYIFQERKDFAFSDFVDEEVGDFNIVSSSNYDVVLDTVAGLTVGDLVYSSSYNYSPITAIDAGSKTVTLHNIKTWSVGAVTIYRGINCQIEFAARHCQNPGVEKHFKETSLLFLKKSFITASVDFYTDNSGGYSLVSIDGNYSSGQWGSGGYGLEAWGGTARASTARVTIPRDKMRGTLLAIRFNQRVGYGEFQLEGLSLQYDFVSERVVS